HQPVRLPHRLRLSGHDFGAEAERRTAVRRFRRAEGEQDAGPPRVDIGQQHGSGHGLWGVLRLLRPAAVVVDEWAALARVVLCADYYRNHGHHQSAVLAVDSNEHALDETHAGAPAAGQSHSGKIQRRSAKDEPEDDGTLEAEQGQSGCGVSADADSASDFLWLLPDVADRHRTARRQFSLGLRSVAGGYRLG